MRRAAEQLVSTADAKTPEPLALPPSKDHARSERWLFVLVHVNATNLSSQDAVNVTGCCDRLLLPPAVALLERQDPHERFHGVDLAVVDLEGLPHRQLIAAALAHAPGHTQPDDAHALVHGDDACLDVAEALEDRKRLRRDVLAAGSELAVRPGHHLAVLVAVRVGREGRVHGGEGLRSI